MFLLSASQIHFIEQLSIQCGGFLSEQWLGKAEPDTYADHLTPSQRKVRIRVQTVPRSSSL